MRPLATSFLVALALLLALYPARPVRAQENPSGRPVLPDIAPRVVEIRGALEISLPSLQRQPLVGFNPPPRVVPIPPERRPWTDAYKQGKADLPPSPLRAPEPPAVSALQPGLPRHGEVEGSFGRYFSRVARLRTEWGATPSTAFHARFDYRGTEGHSPDYLGIDDVDASFDALNARVGMQTTSRMLTLGVDVDAHLQQYALYAAELGTPSALLRDRSPERRGDGLGGALWVRTRGASPVDGELRLHYGGTAYQTDARAPGIDAPAWERRERRLTVDAALAVPVGSQTEARFDARAAVAGIDPDGMLGSTIRQFEGMGGARIRFGSSADLVAGLRVLTFATDAQRPDDVPVEAAYLAPDVRFNFYPNQRTNVYLQNRPTMDREGLADLYRTHPYLVADPIVRPTLRTINVESGANAFFGTVEIDVKAGYVQAPSYRYFEPATTREAGGYTRGVSSVRYGRAGIFHVGGDVSVVLPEGFNASAGVTFRDGRLLDDDAPIPYFGPVVGRAALSYAFFDRRGLLQLTGTYESARYRDRRKTRRLGDFFDLDAALSYNFTPALGAIVRLDNMSTGYLERWDLYEQPPFIATVGIRVLW